MTTPQGEPREVSSPRTPATTGPATSLPPVIDLRGTGPSPATAPLPAWMAAAASAASTADGRAEPNSGPSPWGPGRAAVASDSDDTPSVAPPLTRRSALARERAAEATSRSAHPAEPAEALTAERLLRRPHQAPTRGWRRALFRASGGNIRPGEAPEVLARRAVEARVARRLTGPARFVPVLTRKGGTGKTTVTTLLGMTMATLRPDRVIAVDANPDRGTLAERVPGQHGHSNHTVRHAVQEAGRITTFAAMSELVTRDATRLDILASDTDPATAEVFGEDDYRVVADVVARHYSIVLTDCGTGMVHSVMKGTLDLADSLVLVSGASVDEARLASETLTWLEARGYEDLARSAVVALNTATPTAGHLDLRELRRHFESRCRVVCEIPYDEHLAEGAAIDLDALQPETREAALDLAAAVVDGLGASAD